MRLAYQQVIAFGKSAIAQAPDNSLHLSLMEKCKQNRDEGGGSVSEGFLAAFIKFKLEFNLYVYILDV